MTAMPRTPATAAIAAFGRRAWFGAFVAEIATAVTVAAVVGATTLIALRLVGHHAAPHPAWALVGLPVVAFAWWRARASRLAPATAAAWLDRRLHANGLLLCAQDGALADTVQEAQLAARLQHAAAAMPVIRWRRLAPAPTVALVVLTIVAMLPPPPPPPIPQGGAVARELERAAEGIRDLLARGVVPEDTKRELENKLQDLQQRVAAGDVPDWRDVDQLEQRLDRERLLQELADPAALRPNDGGAAKHDGAVADAAKVTAERLAAVADALDAAGLAAQLPEGLRAMLENARGEHGLDAAALAKDAAALQKLAEAMAGAAGDLAKLDVRGKLDGKQLADLQQIVDQFGGAAGLGGGEGEGEGPGEGEDGEGVGRGGVSRGPGHAALAMTEDAQGDAAKAMPLPPGVAVPSEWVPIGARPAEPDVNPRLNPAAGGNAAAGTGGASWQLQLAPRHRSVVQRFFGTPAATTGTKERR